MHGRLRSHAMWHTDVCRKWTRTPDAWAFQGSRPILKVNQARGQAAHKFLGSANYYCQCSKPGLLVQATNYAKNDKIVVQQKWVIALWELRKVSHDGARHEIIQGRGHTNAYLQEI